MEGKQDYRYCYGGRMIDRDQFLADMRKDAKLNQLIGGPEGEDVVYVFNSDDELLEWAQKKPVENLLKECFQYIKHMQQRRNEAGAEEAIKRDFIQSVERAFQLAQQEKVDLKSGGAQRAFLEKMAERLSKSGDPALVWEHIDFGGDCLPITAGIPDLEGKHTKIWSQSLTQFEGEAQGSPRSSDSQTFVKN